MVNAKICKLRAVIRTESKQICVAFSKTDWGVNQQHKKHTTSKSFDNKYIQIRHIRRHLVSQFSATNVNKQISQFRGMIYESFIKLRSMKIKLYKF
jgi:predicted GTPase